MHEVVGFIGGGQMAEAMIKGLLSRRMFSPNGIFLSEPVNERRQYLEEYYGISTFGNNREVLKHSNILILAVKPQVMDKVLFEIKDDVDVERHLVITIAAGLPIKFYESRLPRGSRLIRVMPNTNALIQSSISAISRGSSATDEDLEIVEKIFGAIGEVMMVEEHLMDAVTALSGSGPAYAALFIEALIDAGVKCGLPRPVAEKLTLATIEGTVKLAKATQRNPYEIKSMVTSPGGTTISALEVLYTKGFPGIVIEAVSEAWKRSIEIRKDFED